MRRLIPFLLFLFLLAAFLRVDFFFTIAYLFFAVYVLSRLWTGRMVENVRAERRFTAHAFFGDQVKVETTIRNNGRLPVPWLEVHESLPVELISPPLYQEVISLGPRERHRFSYTLHCHKRGYYPIGPLQAHTGDLLGIQDQTLIQVSAEYLVVYPKVIPLRRLGLPTRSPLVALRTQAYLFEDPSRVVGVRDYQRGDSPRRIHWTATASAGRLLVKQYQPAIARETLICLDLDEAGYERGRRYDATELAIVVAASLANHIAVREGLPVGLATEAHDPLQAGQVRFFLPPRRERAHLMGLLEVLARAQPARAASFPQLLRRESLHLAWGTTLAVIAGHEGEALFEALAYLRRAGFAVMLILIQARSSAEQQKRAALLGVPIRHVWHERDLEAWR